MVNNQNFIDWSIGKGSLPRSNEQKEMIQSTMLTLYFAHTLDCTVRLFNEIGFEEKSKRWALLSEGIKSSVLKASWDEQKQLFSDYPGGDIFSQQTNILAILCDLVPENQQKELLNRILSYDEFDEMASSYFSFFLFKAMQKTDQEDLFLENLDFWYDFLARGLTTTGETGFATHDRSDSHAWSAHPAYYMLNSVCGIKPAEVGFKSVVISPHLGSLTSVKATMPHTEGLISVTYEISGNELNARIELPKNLNGTWEYNGEVITLKGGLNKIKQSI